MTVYRVGAGNRPHKLTNSPAVGRLRRAQRRAIRARAGEIADLWVSKPLVTSDLKVIADPAATALLRRGALRVLRAGGGVDLARLPDDLAPSFHMPGGADAHPPWLGVGVSAEGSGAALVWVARRYPEGVARLLVEAEVRYLAARPGHPSLWREAAGHA